MARPSIAGTARRSIAEIAAKRDADKAPKSDIDIEAKSESEIALSRESEIPGGRQLAVAERPKTLPKVTLYAHEKVLKAIRLVAVEEGVQAQEILRAAVRDYLATKGHHFSDLTTGK